MGEIKAELLGNFKSIYIAQSTDKELVKKGTSGGFITTTLAHLLERKLVRGCLVVGTNKKFPFLYTIKIARTKQELIEAAGSKYVYIPFTEIKSVIDSTHEDIAVVAAPCHIKTIRNLQKVGKCKNVKYLIGFLCGYCMSFKGTEYLIKKIGIDKKDIAKLEYRGGNYPGGFLVTTKDNKTKFLPKHYYDITNLMFTEKGCRNCNFYTNEFADISVGDAWLKDVKNHSLVIVRTSVGESLFKGLVSDKRIAVKEITADEVLKMHGHNLKAKKYGNGFVISFAAWIFRNFKSILPFPLLGYLAKLRRNMIKK